MFTLCKTFLQNENNKANMYNVFFNVLSNNYLSRFNQKYVKLLASF